MGLYELVRRRCRYIVLCDAEEDPDYKFAGLGMAIRKCRIDFGTEIDIDPSAIIPSGIPKRSQAHCAVGKINYKDGPKGTLVYIKASLTGDEPKDVLQYAVGEDSFPHERTADQWFSESQFESYRVLGYEAAEATIDPARRWQTGNLDTYDLGSLFADLWKHWYPANPALRLHETRHTSTLCQLLTRIAGNSDLHDLGSKLFLTGKNSESGYPLSPNEFYFVMVLLQLVEDIHFDLQLDKDIWLDDPRIGGWVRLFTDWARSDVVEEVWNSTQQTFRADFRTFWDNIRRKARPETYTAKGTSA
jgi:hypothetical protein